jgi:hypothetical protein
MEHWYIEENNIADLYLLGQLSAEVRVRFEQHFIACPECLDCLEQTRSLRAGLRVWSRENIRQICPGVNAEESRQESLAGHQWSITPTGRERPAGQAMPVERIGLARLWTWVPGVGQVRQAALLAAAALLIAGSIAWLVWEGRSESHKLAQAREAVSAWQHRYEEQAQKVRDLTKEMWEREGQFSAQHAQLATQLEREREARRRLEDRVNGGEGHQGLVSIFALSVERSRRPDLSKPINRIALSRMSKSIVLWLELGTDSDLPSYRATLSTVEGQSIWTERGLKPNSGDALALGCNSSLFKPGIYLLTVEGLTAPEQYVPVAKYSFRVLDQ